ncbi:MAG: C4-dicarboxylate ABC transporter permease [Deltaproteobacteria bacterium CG_4_8_14_3_um_filter_51_11]|nr:TRAP transporter large permease [bacterium]OIP41273.1 MAG: C4-dicarboxylate ABC transporter permease [Desulfobacteraceae bacterium CG2_30_51_40]PIX19599.1 MAG: C4-dicarboxylate ABC transporter permease [Deltaproteobacteria bacterium CG_4_8_14_3_um_filter_51_11]PIY22087.1 MAG: C4-dicarboxylate ABC transporter permease [Deltaproteobacteria bacterium CG_4_10_14_3_um_filter_51_14]PJB36308.1 MAG: C4-dicarboxylate ABC transporter permease [Deltaproteobacteria bacterium CG_4_9_14_3_um_filter_51_14]
MSEMAVGLLGLGLLIILFMTGIELAFAMLVVGFLGFGYLVTFSAASNLLVKDFFDTFTSYGFTVIPLFVLMGQVASNSDVAKRLYMAAHKFVGHIPGGLAMTTVVGATLFKAMCGSTLATAATFAGIAIPEMDRFHYDKRLSTGVVASVGTLGMLIPPSIVLIIFGIVVEQSIGRLFLAGIIPGLIIALFFIFIIYGWVRINPQIAPMAQKVAMHDRLRALPEFVWVGVIFLVIMGGLMFGFFSPTEAGTMGTIGVFLLALTHKGLTFKKVIQAFDGSLKTACMTLILIYGSVVLGHFLAITEIPFKAADWITALPIPRSMVMVCIILVYLIGGSFIDDLAFMILATPIFYPAVIKLGYDPIWFGIMIGITIMIGVIIPPVAICVFVVKNITGVPFGTIYRGVLPFLLSLFACALLLFLFPGIATFLPDMIMGS